jgi:hypothetical protein
MAKYNLDILGKEKKENLPYWLDARQKQQASEKHKQIREKYRAQAQAKKQPKAPIK